LRMTTRATFPLKLLGAVTTIFGVAEVVMME
jgi:hypothetical protein